MSFTDSKNFRWLSNPTNEDVSRRPEFISKRYTDSFPAKFKPESPKLNDEVYSKLLRNENISKQKNADNKKRIPQLNNKEESKFFLNCVAGGVVAVIVFKYIEYKMT